MPGPDQIAANLGDGDDSTLIATSSTMDMNGIYLGGTGFDFLELYNAGGEGVKIDFGAGAGGENSAFVSVSGSDIGFTMDEFESLQLTNGNDVVIFEAGVGENLTTRYDADYFIHDMSMFELRSGGVSDGGVDHFYINKGSNLYLNYDFAETGIDAEFGKNAGIEYAEIVGISNPYLNAYVEDTGGVGQLVDYFEASAFSDIITNLSDTGITVNIGTSDGTTYDRFDGSVASAYDMLDARLTYDLAFGKDGDYVTVDGISELNAHEIMAELKNVDFIMVRDDYVDGATDYEQIYAQLHNDDVDFYSDNHLCTTNIKLME